MASAIFEYGNHWINSGEVEIKGNRLIKVSNKPSSICEITSSLSSSGSSRPMVSVRFRQVA